MDNAFYAKNSAVAIKARRELDFVPDSSLINLAEDEIGKGLIDESIVATTYHY